MQSAKRYILRYPWQIALSALLTFCSYFFLASSTNMRMDSDLMQADPYSAMLTAIHYGGRFGLVLLKHLLFLTTYRPLLSGLYFVMFMFLSTQLLCLFLFHFSGENEAFPYLLFALLFGTSHIWSAQTYFIWQEAEIAFAVFLTTLCAGLMLHAAFFGSIRLRLLICPLTFALLVITIGTYQSVLVYYVTCVLILFLMLLYRREHGIESSRQDVQTPFVRSYLVPVLILLVHLFAAYLLYHFIAHTWFYRSDNFASYQAGYIAWGNLPLKQCLMGIAYAIWHTLRFFDAFYTSFYPVAVLCAFFIIWYLFRHDLKEHSKTHALLLLSLCVLMMMPFAFNILFGAEHVQRIQFAIQGVSAFVPAFCMLYLKKRGIAAKVLYGAGICFVALQLFFQFRLLHTDNRRYEQDVSYAKELLEAIDQCDAPEKKVIFLGIRRMDQDTLSLKVSDFGYSYFEWGNTVDPLTANMGGAIRFLRFHENRMFPEIEEGDDLDGILSLAKDMDVFPEEGGLLETERYIIINMGGDNPPEKGTNG